MADIEIVPVEQWAQPRADGNGYRLHDPASGLPHDPAAIPHWAQEALGVQAFRECAGMLRLLVEAERGVTPLDGIQLTELAAGISVFGWQYKREDYEKPTAEGRTLATAEELAMRTVDATDFNTRNSDTNVPATPWQVIRAAYRHIETSHWEQPPRGQALLWAARMCVVDAACWNALASAGEALLQHDEATSFGRERTGVAMSVRPREANNLVRAAALLGLPPDCIEVHYIDPPASWRPAERNAAHRVSEGLSTGRIQLETQSL